MRFSWVYELPQKMSIKTFLKTQGVSRNLLKTVKYHGGKITVNSVEQNVLYFLENNDLLEMLIPDEGEHETTVPAETPIKVIYEDDHYLLVDKPAGVASIPSKLHPENTMANRVKGYYVRQHYVNQIIHIVTRLDRDTTGLMLFAKHAYAHALLDQQLRQKQIHKKYLALASYPFDLPDHGDIKAPIALPVDTIIRREVRADGKDAWTEYWVKEKFEQASLLSIQLHTGRTHQIRVHFEHIYHPLVGDELYGGDMSLGLTRQALHCSEICLFHPFLKKEMTFHCPLPTDMKKWLENEKIKVNLKNN